MFLSRALHSLKQYLISRNMVEPKIKEFGYNLCRKYLGGEWKEVPLTKFEIERVHGGLTNHLFVCSLPDTKANPVNINKVLLRLYGAFYSDMSDSTVRMMEECIICGLLAEKNMGPDLYGIFPEGRLEQFIPDVRSLTSTEVRQPQLSRQIAKHVAAFHKLTLPLSKEGTWLLESLEKFVEEVKQIKFSDPESDKSKQMEEILNRFDLDDSLRYVRQVAENSNSPVLFCHNDVQPGNLLVKTCESLDVAKIKVIDFEYSCYNYRGFDIGNHFCEWVNDYNYPHYPYFIGDMSRYPSHDEKVFFVRTYLQAFEETESVTEEEIEKVIIEADRLSLLSHFFWAMFSILQSYKSTIDFGYLEYALYRLECFEHFKYFAQDERRNGSKTSQINGKF